MNHIERGCLNARIAFDEFKVNSRACDYSDRIDIKDYCRKDRKYGFIQGALEAIEYITSHYELTPTTDQQ